WPARPESGERHRAPPFPRILRWCSPQTFRRLFRRTIFGTWPWPLLHLLDDLFQLQRHLRNRLSPDLHLACRALANNNVERAERIVLGGKIIAEMRSPAFLSL